MLWSERTGRGRRIVLAHGFTQNRRCWGSLAGSLAIDHELVRVDLPGHGLASDVRADLPTAGRLLVEAGGAGTYLGYSLGGRVGLHAALDAPDTVRGLVLVGATGGLDTDADRRARIAADEALAARLEDEGLEAFLDHWLQLPLFGGLGTSEAGLEARLENTVAGLASSLRLAGTGTQEPLWGRLPSLSMPVLVTAGALDDKFSALAERLVECIGANAELALIPGAGHAAHLERPHAFVDVLRPWLNAHGL
jgi:2-succinyl-6-hydroxy-2,4-cyclohexadiene-1-carboxylate synthase